MDSGYRAEIQSQIQSAISVIEKEYQLYQDGEQTEEQAKEAAKEAVRAMRYREEKGGYIWIDALDGTLIMHPILSDQEGDNRYMMQDSYGTMITQEVIRACQSAEKGGFVQSRILSCAIRSESAVCPISLRCFTASRMGLQ